MRALTYEQHMEDARHYLHRAETQEVDVERNREMARLHLAMAREMREAGQGNSEPTPTVQYNSAPIGHPLIDDNGDPSPLSAAEEGEDKQWLKGGVVERAVRAAKALVPYYPLSRALDVLATCAAEGLEQRRVKALAAAIIVHAGLHPLTIRKAQQRLSAPATVDVEEIAFMALNGGDHAAEAVLTLDAWFRSHGHGSLLEALAEHAPDGAGGE